MHTIFNKGWGVTISKFDTCPGQLNGHNVLVQYSTCPKEQVMHKRVPLPLF